MVIRAVTQFEMIPGIDRLRTANQLLQKEPDGSAWPLLGGASEVWSAMFELPQWPPELREKAIELQHSLFRYGTIQMTLEQMVEPERLQLKRDLLQFIEFAEQLNGRDADGREVAIGDGNPGRMSDGLIDDVKTGERPR